MKMKFKMFVTGGQVGEAHFHFSRRSVVLSFAAASSRRQSRATDDADGDSMTDYAPYIAGTDPTDFRSFFAFTKPGIVHNGQTTRDSIEWFSVSNRTYSIFAGPILSTNAGDYTLIASNVTATPPRNAYTNAIMPGARFYRVQVFKTD